MMAAWFASGAVFDAILVLTLAEWLLLAMYFRVTGRGVSGRHMAANLAAGAALLLTLHLVVAGAWWGWLGLCLALAGLAHLIDLRQRWGR